MNLIKMKIVLAFVSLLLPLLAEYDVIEPAENEGMAPKMIVFRGSEYKAQSPCALLHDAY